MSLNLGDTFYLPNMQDSLKKYLPDSVHVDLYSYYYWEEGLPIVVDSVCYIDHKKCIRFKKLDNGESAFFSRLPIYFIEGIGATYAVGYIFRQMTTLFLPILNCAYKDDSLSFMFNSVAKCRMIPADIKTLDHTIGKLNIYPNPTQDYLYVHDEDATSQEGEIIVTNTLGMVIYRHITLGNETRIDVQQWNAGIYILQYRTPKGSRYFKFVKK